MRVTARRESRDPVRLTVDNGLGRRMLLMRQKILPACGNGLAAEAGIRHPMVASLVDIIAVPPGTNHEAIVTRRVP